MLLNVYLYIHVMYVYLQYIQDTYIFTEISYRISSHGESANDEVQMQCAVVMLISTSLSF